MSSYRYYNIQLLPLNNRTTALVGINGYRSLFEQLGTRAKREIEKRSLEYMAYELRNEMYFAPFTVHDTARDEYCFGQFVKFDVAKSVKNLYTKKLEFEGGPGSTAHPFYFRFVFDYRKHILAIEDTKGRLPAPSQLINAFYHLLDSIAHEHFPSYRLDVQQLASDEALELVLKNAVGYRRIDVSITYSNSDELLDELLKEITELGIHKTTHTEAAAKGEYIERPSRVGLALLDAAKKFGNATVTYLEEANEKLKQRVFQMRDHPVKIVIPEGKEETQVEYREKIRASIQVADEKSKKKVPIKKLGNRKN